VRVAALLPGWRGHMFFAGTPDAAVKSLDECRFCVIESRQPNRSEPTPVPAVQGPWASALNFGDRANYPECPPAVRKKRCIAERRIFPSNIPGGASRANIAPAESPDTHAAAST